MPACPPSRPFGHLSRSSQLGKLTCVSASARAVGAAVLLSVIASSPLHAAPTQPAHDTTTTRTNNTPPRGRVHLVVITDLVVPELAPEVTAGTVEELTGVLEKHGFPVVEAEDADTVVEVKIQNNDPVAGAGYRAKLNFAVPDAPEPVTLAATCECGGAAFIHQLGVVLGEHMPEIAAIYDDHARATGQPSPPPIPATPSPKPHYRMGVSAQVGVALIGVSAALLGGGGALWGLGVRRGVALDEKQGTTRGGIAFVAAGAVVLGAGLGLLGLDVALHRKAVRALSFAATGDRHSLLVGATGRF